jgi:SAM-dependent methyltransferase
MKISRAHPNRRAHNWLIYDIGDDWLYRFRRDYRGHLFDLGCGEMPYKNWLLSHAEKYTGVDWSGTPHECKADILADLNNPLPIESQVADTVVSFSVLEHLCEPQAMLNEASRILKPGGTMVLQVPWQWWIHEAPHDYFRYTPYGLQYMFKKAGFVDVVVEPQSGFFTMWILKFNYFTLRLLKGPEALRWLIKGCLVPVWFVGQVLAPWLDKLDRKWDAETTGYFVVARKPGAA